MANGGIKDGLTGRQRSANSWYSRTKRGKVKLFTNVPGDVLHTCSEGNCTWHGRQLHFYRQHPTDESGRQVNRQAWKWSIHWRQDSWWMGCRDARLPPRHWKQFSQCQSGRNKWLKYRLGHTVMDFQTLMLCRSTTLSGGGPPVGSLAEHWSRLTTRDTSNSPGKRKAHKQPIWSTVDVFIISSLFWQR